MAMSKAIAAPFKKKGTQAKPISEYAAKASPKKTGPKNGATNRLKRGKRNGS